MRHLFGLHITRHLPRGVDLVADLRHALPAWTPSLILDVGANVGQSARRYLRAFPRAQVHAFEPEPGNFAQLTAALQHPRLRCWRVAVSDEPGRGRMVEAGVFAHLEPDGDTPVVALDGWAAAQGITGVGLLKIDTEGHDLHVLRGAQRLLGAHRVDLVQVEAGIDPENGRHVPLTQLAAYLVDRSYLPFGFYDQTPEFNPPRPALRRVDAVFIRSTL